MWVAALTLTSTAAFAWGYPPPHHPAPAPLLAAGIPAFAAVGGGAGIMRLLRRVRGKDSGGLIGGG